MLVPVKATVEALCCRDANLFTANVAITFLLKKHKDANNFISQKLHSSLVLRMQQMRTDVSGILQYLHNGRTNVQPESEIDLVTVPSSIKCRKLIVPFEIISDSSDSPSESISFALEKSKSITDELNKTFKKAYLHSIQIRRETLSVKIQKEMLLFENGGTLSDFLQRAYNFLMTIKPTSVESERAFSEAGLFATKKRSRLGN